MLRTIHPSARKHGIDDEDILHAIRLALAVKVYDDDVRVLYLGPDRAANMLEVVSLLEEDEDHELVIHAMAMTNKYEPLLRGLGDPED